METLFSFNCDAVTKQWRKKSVRFYCSKCTHCGGGSGILYAVGRNAVLPLVKAHVRIHGTCNTVLIFLNTIASIALKVPGNYACTSA